MAAGLSRNIVITEYAPRKIKQSITGNGNAAKEQVGRNASNTAKIYGNPPIFWMQQMDWQVAVCHSFQRIPVGKTGSKKSYSGWDTFVKDNTSRVAGLAKKK